MDLIFLQYSLRNVLLAYLLPYYFLMCWKPSSVVPDFKNWGETSDHSNYRPFDILFGKLLEALNNSEFGMHLTSQDFLSDMQYRFRFSRSIADVWKLLFRIFLNHLSRFDILYFFTSWKVIVFLDEFLKCFCHPYQIAKWRATLLNLFA